MCSSDLLAGHEFGSQTNHKTQHCQAAIPVLGECGETELLFFSHVENLCWFKGNNSGFAASCLDINHSRNKSQYFFRQIVDGSAIPLGQGDRAAATPPSRLGHGQNCPIWLDKNPSGRSEERRVGKECRSRWSPYH